MPLTADHLAGLAPDASVLASARKLASPGLWTGLGRNADALWGECQGSALYQVRVSLVDLASKCSCPSRRFPCKHALGLMLLAVDDRHLPAGTAPDWVGEWLAKRAESAQRKQERTARKDETPDPAAQAKRMGKRASRIQQGLDALDLWMDDLVRNGLGTLDERADAAFAEQAARLVDAQAPGLAARLRQIARIPRGQPEWAERVLDELGLLALLTHAARRLDRLAPPLAADVRGALGLTLAKNDVAAGGDLVEDRWAVIGQIVDDSDRIRVQRTWLRGLGSKRDALVLQFAAGSAPFTDVLVPGTVLPCTLAFWPGAVPLRALVHDSPGEPHAIDTPLPRRLGVATFLTSFAELLGRQPWLERVPCALTGVVPVVHHGTWFAVEASGDALPLTGPSHWVLHALAGGSPLDLVGEWDGHKLTPLGAVVSGRFHALLREAA